VTFLFTDIEGSTRLWENHPDAMRVALARHDAILTEALAAYDGHLFKTAGDAFCAAFTAAPGAATAALAAQRALHAEPWSESVPLRVRIALYTGDEERDSFGPALGRVTRLAAAAHGGQVLLSQATADRCRDALPEHAVLRELGLYRLKDLRAPERIFQLLHPALPAEFPPLRSLEAFAHNLPRPATSFIGRQREIAAVTRLLAESRLLTLTGTGGCGKTRLALEVASRQVDAYPEGVWWAPLERVADPALVAQAVGAAMGVPVVEGAAALDALADALRPRALLLVLDNCEHLLTGAAALVETLLLACPYLTVLATSREGLGIAGEAVYRVPPLSLPPNEPGIATPPASQTAAVGVSPWPESEAVQLFAARAAAAAPGFALTADNAAAVGEICRRLDGLPLALELVAARAGEMAIERLAQRLDDGFHPAAGEAPAPGQTLVRTMDWSYDLLSEPEQALLRRLSVFAGGWDLEAAEAVCADDVLDLLTALVEKSLVQHEAGALGTRYRLLETVRRYAQERLRASGESEAMRRRHRDWFAARGEQIGALLESPRRARGWEEAEAEYENLRAALEACAADGEGQEAAARLLRGLGPFWFLRGHMSEGRDLLERIRHLGAPSAPATAQLALEAGLLARQQGDAAAAAAHYQEALRLSREIGDLDRAALALESLGYVALQQGDVAAARTWFEEAHAIFCEKGDTGGIAGIMQSLGHVYRFEGEFARARALYERAIALGENVASGYRNPVDHALLNLGHLERLEGNRRQAGERYRQGLRGFAATRDRGGMAFCLEGMACLAADEGEAERAACLFGAAEALREEAEIPLPPVDRAGYMHALDTVRAALGEAAFAAAWATGRMLPPDVAIARALAAPE
jgi:predicted ATPase/class 3 adenylate cyclase